MTGSGNAAWVEAGKQNLAKTRRANGLKAVVRNRASGFFTPERQSKRRVAQINAEEAMAETMRAEGYEVFSPTVVCDRIAVKDGKVLFVEFKKPGQELRPGQQRIHDLVPLMYLVRYDSSAG